MPRAIWKGTVAAEADRVQTVEGNTYFPVERLRMAHLRPSETQIRCGWKGIARYYDLVVDGEVNREVAWTCRDPLPEAVSIKDMVAFRRGVEVLP